MCNTNNEMMVNFTQLILKRDALIKEQEQLWFAYMKQFGEEILQNFALKVESIKLKKTLAFCQEKQNRFLPIVKQELDSRIGSVMQDYYQEMDSLYNVVGSKGTPITEVEYLKVKKIYHELAKKIHPDLNANLANNETIKQLWEQVVVAYNNNDYSRLEELRALVNKEIGEDCEIQVEDLLEKIEKIKQEIDQIVTTDPYQYKYLLQSDDLVAQKKQELAEEKQDLQEYVEQLQKELEKFEIVNWGN